MIELTDTELVGWLADIVDPVPVTLGMPGEADDEGRPTITCHLLAIVPVRTARTNLRAAVEAVARYLVTADATDPIEAHGLLGRVLVAASARDDVALEHEEPALALWRALGLPPRPALVLRAPVRWPAPQPDTPLVRHPVTVDWRDLQPLNGLVVSPGGTPVARAQLRLSGADAPTWTGSDGRFTIAGAPVGADTLTVTARGRTRTVTFTPAEGSDPLTVVFDPEE